MSNVMGPEDAIAWLNTDDYDSAGYHVAVEHAIGALQMQVPRKPEKCTIRAYNRVFGRCVEEKTFTCSVCGHFVRSGWNYCKNCGSAIDWSEE